MILYPNAKINIGLNICEKRSDGFHNIDSVFYPIPWKDILEILPSERSQFTYSGCSVDPQNNSVLQAYELMKEEYNIQNLHIHLHKQIPQGSGLGGGSADATFCLIGINQLLDLKITDDILVEMALKLGSDCPFFIFNKPSRVTGRGEQINPIKSELDGLFIKLIYPEIHISTIEAFQGISPINNSINLKDNILSKDSFQDLKNDFEKSALLKHAKLQEIREQLLNEGAIHASMSGSGSTIYGIFENEPKSDPNNKNEKVFELN